MKHLGDYVILALIAAAIFLGRRRGRRNLANALAAAQATGYAEGHAAALASASAASNVAVHVGHSFGNDGASGVERAGVEYLKHDQYDVASELDDIERRLFQLRQVRGLGHVDRSADVGGVLGGVQHRQDEVRELRRPVALGDPRVGDLRHVSDPRSVIDADDEAV